MQGYQWDSHHQHHAPAQAYPTPKQMEGKSLLSRKFSFYLTPFGVRLKRKYPLRIARKYETSPIFAVQNLRIFISKKVSPKVTTISSILSTNPMGKFCAALRVIFLNPIHAKTTELWLK
jgi:hypothetical protein